ncbi:MAG: hypothetical protein AVDCRST_MAG68-1098, partial [uncultured Gemmatimonadetes bacterium]
AQTRTLAVAGNPCRWMQPGAADARRGRTARLRARAGGGGQHLSAGGGDAPLPRGAGGAAGAGGRGGEPGRAGARVRGRARPAGHGGADPHAHHPPGVRLALLPAHGAGAPRALPGAQDRLAPPAPGEREGTDAPDAAAPDSRGQAAVRGPAARGGPQPPLGALPAGHPAALRHDPGAGGPLQVRLLQDRPV